jgi:hypothetical protein
MLNLLEVILLVWKWMFVKYTQANSLICASQLWLLSSADSARPRNMCHHSLITFLATRVATQSLISSHWVISCEIAYQIHVSQLLQILSSLSAEHTNSSLVGSHFKIIVGCNGGAQQQQQLPGSFERKPERFLSTGVGVHVYVRHFCFLYHFECTKFFCTH